jgi:hypothetical protein
MVPVFMRSTGILTNRGELHKVTGHGVGGDCERVMFYETNDDQWGWGGGVLYSTSTVYGCR